LLSLFAPGAGARAQAIPAPQRAEAPALQLQDLMRMLAAQERGAVRFRETRHFARLKEPVVVTGTLSFQRPDRLTKLVERPRWERIDVVRNEVSIRTGENDTPRVIQLAEIPALNGLIVALRATLVGDQAQLVEMFAIHPTGTPDAWRLDLVPRSSAIQEKVSQIAIAGRKGIPVSFTLTQRNGDRIVIDIIEP
jgi:hypothetical protein